MNRLPEAVAAEAIEHFWLAVQTKFQSSGLAANDLASSSSLKALGALEQQALDTATAAMVTFLTLRTMRLCAESEGSQ